MSGCLIPAWSFSTWKEFQKCKHKIYLDKVAKAPKPPIESTEEREHPLLRGTRVHDAAELYIKDNVELIKELKKFQSEFDHLKDLYGKGQVEVEQPWAFASDWSLSSWSSKDAWVRAKLDSLVKYNGNSCVVIDFKTGKKWGNEVTHNLQGQLYAVMTFLKYPEIEYATVEFWYTDQNDITSKTYTRDQALRFLPTWTQRGKDVTSETEFKANPSNIACKWCPFGSHVGSGVCEYKI